MNKRQSRIPSVVAKFALGQYFRISKEKMKFAKGAEQNYSTEIFKIDKVIRRTPRPLYEHKDLNERAINDKEELTPVRVTKKRRTK
jgi:hypothetical protein